MIRIHNLALVLLATSIIANAGTLDTAISYQGKLIYQGTPAEGLYDFEFHLYDAQSGGLPLALVPLDEVAVSDGLFTVELDFGLGFDSQQYWLQIGVREGGSTGGFTGLLPRQRLSPVPYSLHAQTVALNAIGSGEIADGAITSSHLAANSVTSVSIMDGSIDGAHMAADAIDSSHLQTGAVGSAQIASGAVGSNEIAAGAVSSTALADAAVVATKLAPASVGAAAVIPSEVQRRVSGSCADGTYLAGITEAGDVICRALPVGLASTIHPGSFGASIAVRQSGLPIMAFETTSGLTIFECSNVVCSDGLAHTPQPGSSAQATAMLIRQSGLPLIAYQKRFDKDLEVYDCADTACMSGTIHVLDTGAEVGSDLDIAMRSSGNPVISYRDRGLETVKLYDCSDSACTTGTARTLGAGGAFGGGTGIAIRSGDRPMVSWFDGTDDQLRAYDCDDAGCTSGTVRVLTSHGGAAATTGIIIGASGAPLIVSQSNEVLLFECSSDLCSSGNLITVTSGENPSYVGIIAGQDGQPLIAFTVQADEALKIFDCYEDDCSDGVVHTLSPADNSGLDLALSTDGNPLITFRQPKLNGSVRIYTCGDQRCEN